MKLENIDWKKYKKQIIIGTMIVLLILFGGIYLVHASSIPNETEEVEVIEIEETIKEENTSNVEKVLVDVKGAVVNPGVLDVLYKMRLIWREDYWKVLIQMLSI